MSIIDNNIEIRSLSENDILSNKQIIIALLIENYNINFPEKSDLKKYADNSYIDLIKFIEDKTAILIGAFKNDKLVGFLWAYRRDVLGDKRMHIDHIIVDSQNRSKGIGKELLNNLEKIAIRENIYIIDLMTTFNNIETMNFYKNNGYILKRVQFEKQLEVNDDN